MSPTEAKELMPGDWLRWDATELPVEWQWYRVRKVGGGAVHLQSIESVLLGDRSDFEDTVVGADDAAEWDGFTVVVGHRTGTEAVHSANAA